MGICNLDQNKELAKSLATYLNISIKKSLKGNEPFKLIGVMNNIYDIAFKKDQDINKALGIAGAIPKLFLELLKKKPEYLLQLAEKGFKIDPIIQFNTEIENSDKPLELIGNYVRGISSPTVAQTIQNSVNTGPVTKTITKEAKSVPAYSDRKLLGDTFKSTTGRSVVKKLIGTYEMDQSDPAKVASYSALQQILMQQKDEANFEDIEYDGHTGFKLIGAIEGSLPEKSIYTTKKGSTALVVAITDNQGNFRYFDDAGKITDAENGKVAYFPLRRIEAQDIQDMVEATIEKEADNLRLDTQGDPEAYELRQSAQRKAFTKEFTKQAQLINDIRKKVNANEKVLLDITGGIVGSIDDRAAKSSLSEFNLSEKEKASIGEEFADFKIGNRTLYLPAIKFDNYNKLVTLKGMSVKIASPDLFNNLIDLLVDNLIKNNDPVSPQEKVELFKQYVEVIEEGKMPASNKLLLSLGDSKLNIYAGGKFISLEDKEQAKKDLSEFLGKNAYHTYIKTLTGTYNSFTIDNGVLIVKQEPSYKEFISKYIVPRITLDISTKRPMVNNGYFTFEETNLKEITAEQSIRVVEKAKEEIKKSKYDTDDLSNALDRSKLIASRASASQKAAADKWIAEAGILKVKVNGKPVLTTEDARNIVNSDAFATFAKTTMTLYKGGDSTHMYHETWHGFSQIYLKKSERDKLYTDAGKINNSFTYVKKVPGPGGNTIEKVKVKLNTLNPNNPSDRKILEEFIAEEFRTYAMNNGQFKTKTPTGLKDIFKRIWELLKALFKGTIPVNVHSTPGSSVFSEMFSALYNAKEASDLNMFQPGIQNAEFGTLNTGLINQLSELDLDLISRSMDGIISEVTTDLILNKNKPGAAMQIFASTKTLDFLYNVTIKKALTNRLNELILEKATNEDKWNAIQLDYHLNNINILQKTLDNFGDIKTILANRTDDNSISAYHLKNSAFAGRIREAIQEPTDIAETTANDIMARNDKKANDVESEKLATASAIYIMQSLIQQEYNQGKTRITNKLNKLGFPQTIEFKPFWNFLMNKVGGEQNEGDLYNKLQEIKSKKITPLIQQLLDKVGNPAEVMTANKISADIWLGLVRSMNLTRIDLHNNIFESTTDGEGNEVLTAVSGRVSADYHNIKNNIWKNKFNLEVGPFVNINSDKQNELNLEAIGKAFLTSPSNYKEGVLDRDLILRYRLKKGQDPIAFLNAVGIYMSNDYEVRDAITPEAIDYIADAIGQAWFNQIPITDPVKFLSNSRVIKVQRLVGSKLEVVSGMDNKQFKTESNASRVNDLALIEAEYSTEYSSQMKPLPSGDKKSIHSLNSTTTRIVSAINHAQNINDLDNTNGDYGIVPQYNYNRNPTIMGSIFKNSLFDGTNTKIKNRTLILRELVGSQHKILKGAVEGLSHGEMTASEKFVTDLQSMLTSGFIEAVRSGEKSTYYAMRPNKIVTLANYSKNSDHLFFDTEHFLMDNQGRSITSVRVNEYLLEVMHKKLEGELRRIQKINNGITEEEALSLGLEAKDAKGFYKNHVKGFENGGKFDWFDDILEAKTESNLKNTLINMSDQLSTNNDLRFLLSQTDEGKALKKLIDTQILSYFKNLANELKVQDYDKIYEGTVPEFLRAIATKNLNELQKSRVTNQGIIDGLMMSFAVNTALQSDEVLLTIFGDGFQFNHTKDEGTKRVPTYNSPGIVYSTGNYSVAAINQYYPRAYEAKLIADGTITTRTSPRLFSKIGQKAILKESEVPTARYAEYHQLFKNILSKRNYTIEQVDKLLYGKNGTYENPVGGSVMDTWAKIKDADGQGYVSFDYYRMLKANENNWTNAQEILYQKEIKGDYISAEEIFDAFPVYKLQYAGPLAIKGTVYPVQSIDKFSLLPLIPSLVKDTPLDSIHKQMISQGADYILFDSGAKRSYIKSGKSNGDEIFEGNDTSNLVPDFKFTLNPYYVDFLKNQTEVNKEFKGKTRLSTQFRKLFDVTLYHLGVPVDYTGTKAKWDSLTKTQKEKASQIHRKTEAVLNELARLTTYMRKDLLTELGWEEKDGKLVGDVETMISYIKGKLEEQGYSKQEIESIETDDGKIDLSTSPIAPRLERFLFSIVNNRLIRLKIKGESFVQGSAAFFQKFAKPTSDQLKAYDDFGTNGLRGYVVDPTGKENTKGVRVKIALTENYENLYNTRFFINGKISDQTIGVYNHGSIDHAASFKRLNEIIKTDAWLEHDNNRKKIQITGVRIPVQGANSTEFAEVWDFLPPSAGPIIIIPAEIVAKSGGDFDVDKLTMYIKNITNQGSLLEDNFNTPDDITSKINQLQDKLEDLKATKLNIKNSLDDFRKSITDIQGYVTMSKEQINSFTTRNNKALLETLSVPENQEFLKEVAKDSYEIYNKYIKSFVISDYDKVNGAINTLFGREGELNSIYKELSDLKEHKRNFTGAIQNTLIDNIIQVLQMPEMAFSLLLPNGTYLTKPYADELQDILREVDNEVDYTKSINTGEKISGRPKGVSPSVLRNYNYNLKKQQDNVTGKRILGPIVLEIPVNNLFNKAGAMLNHEITEVIKIKNVPTDVHTPITLELKHNTIDNVKAAKSIKQISMSNLLDADKQNQIADVLSQLANGAVDVGKDAWIAYLQGNLEAIPKILFLLETGVPIAEIAYFVNNPLIREYVRLKQRAKSKLGKLFFGPKHNSSTMINDYLDKKLTGVKKFNTEAAFNLKTLWGKYNLLKSFIEATKVEAFDKETLRSVAKGKGTEDQKMAGLLEYLYVEQLTSYHDKLKAAVDVDNNVTGDNAEVQAKIEEISEAETLPIYDPSTLKHLKEESVLSSFFIQELSADLFGERFFSFRANPALDKFIRDIQKNYKLMGTLKKITGITKETFAPKFKNALTLHILSNALSEFDINADSYKGQPISKLLEGSMIKSVDQAIEDFKGKKFLYLNKSNEGYFQRGLYPINELYVTNYTPADFVKLTLEREYLRKHIMPLTDTFKESVEFKSTKKEFEKQAFNVIQGMTQEEVDKLVYESMILHQALLNTYNNYEMFSSGEHTVAKRLINIIRNYPDLTYKYGSLLERFTLDALPTYDGSNPRRNFKLKANSDISKPETEHYYKMWQELANPNEHKLSGVTDKDLAANKYISDFFAQLPVFSFLQSGMDPGQFSMNSVMPTDSFKPIMDQAADIFKKEVLDDKVMINAILGKFFNLFLVNNNIEVTTTLKGRGLNYKSNLYKHFITETPANITKETSKEKLQKLEIDTKAIATTIKQSIESSEPFIQKARLISDADITSFKSYITKTNGVFPKQFFTSNTKFKAFYNDTSGRREGAPQSSKWLLNSKQLYDLVDQVFGEIYLENINLETGYQEGPTEGTGIVKDIEKFEAKKVSAINSIIDTVKNNRLDEVLAEKGYDVKDIIGNLEASTNEDDLNKIINKLLKLIC